MHKYRNDTSSLLLFAGLSVFGSLTGCVAYGNVKWFGGARDVRLEDGNTVSLWLKPTHSNVDVPPLVYYTRSSPPYTLQVFFQSVEAYRSVEIEKVTVRYSSGTEETRSGRLRRTITPYEKERGITFWDPPLKDLVTRHEDCTISVTGSFITSGGRKSPFSVTKDFKAEGGSGFAPYWKAGE